MEIPDILQLLDEKEIDYRFTSNHCTGYIFYFLDGSIYPRHWYDGDLDNECEIETIAESGQHIFERVVNDKLQKDWKHRIEEESLSEVFKKVEDYLSSIS